MSEINVPVVRVAFFFVESKSCIAMLEGPRKVAALPAHRPGAVMSLQCDLGIVELARDPEEISGSLLGLVKLQPVHTENRQIGDGWRQVG